MFKRAFRGAVLVLVGAWCGLLTVNAQADDFQFGFANEAVDPDVTIDCNRGGVESRCAFGGNTASYTDPTPYLQEVVYVDGVRYYHSIVGDPLSDFAQEVYINASGCCFQAGRNYDPFPRSASGGNGAGNPTRVVMRNMIQDDEITQWFIKDNLAFKPLITQTVANVDVLMQFQIDMSTINYGAMDNAGDVSNNLQLLNRAYLDAGDYDNSIIPSYYSDQAKFNQSITAGRYAYTPGIGEGGSDGAYTYWDGGYDEYLADQNLFRRDDQNIGAQIRR